jgi:hypothetical protein
MLALRVRTAVSVLLVVAAAGLCARPLWAQQAQSLADVAKKEEERRKTVPAPAKVYTNKDLTAAPGPPSTPASPEAAAAAKAAADMAKDAAKGTDKEKKDDEPAKDQAYWAGRLKTLKDKLDRDTAYADAMQTRVNSLTADFVNRDDPAQRATIERDRQKSMAELARLQQDIVKGKKAIADLQEEARRAGVPPGWLR